MLNTAFPPWPSFTSEECDAVRDVLLSNAVNYWTGTQCREFESEFAAWVGVDHAIAVSNGTVALEVALHALGVGHDDDVVVTPRTFIASASTVVLAGATPIFADVDPDTQNITVDSIARVLTPRCKAIICVHLAGMPCDMDPIMDLAKRHGLYVIEDCAQAHGARYRGRSVGGIGDIGTWSFCQDKIMTTGGEGGMLTTNADQLWSQMWSFKDHGKSWDAVYNRSHPQGFRWLHESFGTNARMTEMQAAIGRIQLSRVDSWVSVRRQYAKCIWSAASRMPGLRVPRIPDWAEHAGYKCYLFIDRDRVLPGWNRDKVVESICAAGVPCYSGSCSEIYLEKAFVESHLSPPERLRNAASLGGDSLMFLVHPTLLPEHIDKTIEVLGSVMRAACS